jgi:uncharacterized protein (DUF433 family)
MGEIVQDPDHSNGEPTINNTGIRALNVASAYEHSGYSPNEIIGLTLEDVHTALAYYCAHIDEFREVMSSTDRDRSETPA